MFCREDREENYDNKKITGGRVNTGEEEIW